MAKVYYATRNNMTKKQIAQVFWYAAEKVEKGYGEHSCDAICMYNKDYEKLIIWYYKLWFKNCPSSFWVENHPDCRNYSIQEFKDLRVLLLCMAAELVLSGDFFPKEGK